jgi:hypothetical protein
VKALGFIAVLIGLGVLLGVAIACTEDRLVVTDRACWEKCVLSKEGETSIEACAVLLQCAHREPVR